MIIKAADLSNASSIFEAFFDGVKAQAEKLSQAIDVFRNDASFKEKFKSAGYEAARNYMGVYITALKKLNTVCDAIVNNIISANNSIISAMSGYTEIDLSKKAEIETNLTQLKTNLDNAYAEYNAAKEKKVKNYCQQTIQKLTADIAEVEKFLTIIKNTEAAYSSAKGLIGGEVSSTIQSYGTLIGNFCV